MEIREAETLNQARDLAFKQIVEISKNGCSQFKCKDCVMNKLCDHYPLHSKVYAEQMILIARSQNA